MRDPKCVKTSADLRPYIVGFVDETFKISQLYHVIPDNAPRSYLDTSATAPDTSVFSPACPVATAPVTDEKDAFYFARYTDIIGPRFDMFDSTSRYFSLVLPQIALSNRLVLLSCLAAAARQYSLVANRGHHDALTYYNEALKILRKRLDDSRHEAATFASCLLIAHCEMVESKASDWNLHLKGTGELVVMHNWNGRSGGLAQAVRLELKPSRRVLIMVSKSFWIYCRMIILASLSSGMPTAVDFRHWLPPGYSPGSPDQSLDAWQRKVVYLLGSIHNFWARTRNDQTPDALDDRTTEWNILVNELARHKNEAPELCRALSAIPADAESPFERVRYVNGPVSAAWQMLHTAYFILTLSQPCPRAMRPTILGTAEVTHKALSYAKKIVSNSIANRCTIAWANAVQLLTLAGQCLLEARERQACSGVLEDIQHHTGWDTRASVERLNMVWRRHSMNRGVSLNTMYSDIGILLYDIWLGDEGAQY